MITELTLAGPAAVAGQRRALAVSSDGGSVFVLVGEADGHTLIAVVDTAGLTVSASLDLDRDLRYRGIAVGRRTGRIYLFANQSGDAVVQLLDPMTQGVTTWLARQSDGRNWLVYQGGVTADESALFLSYHGPDTTGIDRFEIGAGGLTRCRIPAFVDSGCFRAHGSFALFGGELFAATGGPLVMALDAATGARRRDYDLGLEGNHLMEFTITRAAALYAVGSCGYNRGLAVAELASSVFHVLVPPGQSSPVCGERIVALDDSSLLVVAKTAVPAPALIPGALVVLSPRGEIVRTIRTSAEPVDLLLSR